MRKTSNLFTLLFFGLFAMSMVLFTTACGESEGCTDPAAENYDADAESDDGTCVYAADKFIGSYTGSIACGVVLGPLLDNDSFPFSIVEAPGGGPNDIVINLMGSIPVAFTATVSGDNLTISTQLPGLPLIDIDMDGTPENFDLDVSGNASISGTTINGTITITATNDLLPGPLTDQCTIQGTMN